MVKLLELEQDDKISYNRTHKLKSAEDFMSDLIYVDPELIKGASLRKATFIKEFDRSWVIQSENPEKNNIEKYEQIAEEEVLQMYPELSELFNTEFDETLSFRKGINSGKWYDFH